MNTILARRPITPAPQAPQRQRQPGYGAEERGIPPDTKKALNRAWRGSLKLVDRVQPRICNFTARVPLGNRIVGLGLFESPAEVTETVTALRRAIAEEVRSVRKQAAKAEKRQSV